MRYTLLGCCLGIAVSSQAELLPLTDSELAAVSGQAGFSFQEAIQLPPISQDQLQPILSQLENQRSRLQLGFQVGQFALNTGLNSAFLSTSQLPLSAAPISIALGSVPIFGLFGLVGLVQQAQNFQQDD